MYEQFKANHMFIIKTNTRSFNAVAPDMKLEQTMQRSKKGAGEYYWSSKKKCIYSWVRTCLSWNVGHNNYFSRISKLGKLNDRDLDLHNEHSEGYSEAFSE